MAELDGPSARELVARRRYLVQQMRMRGYNSQQILQNLTELGFQVSINAVNSDIAAVRESFRLDYVDDRKAMAMEETEVLRDIRRRAYEALDVPGQWKGERTELMHVILETNARISKLWGLEQLPANVLNVLNVKDAGDFFEKLLRVAASEADGQTVHVPAEPQPVAALVQAAPSENGTPRSEEKAP